MSSKLGRKRTSAVFLPVHCCGQPLCGEKGESADAARNLTSPGGVLRRIPGTGKWVYGYMGKWVYGLGGSCWI